MHSAGANRVRVAPLNRPFKNKATVYKLIELLVIIILLPVIILSWLFLVLGTGLKIAGYTILGDFDDVWEEVQDIPFLIDIFNRKRKKK